MRRIDRKELRAPARVLDLELTPADQAGGETLPVRGYETLWCLSRTSGIPQEISFWDVAGDTSVSLAALRAELRAPGSAAGPAAAPAGAASLTATVVVCTRDRPAGLRTTLASLRRQHDPDFDVLVVDNGSCHRDVEQVVQETGLPRVDCVAEPQPGLARARNRGLGAVRTELVAWIDDDEVADPDWLRRLKEGFRHAARPAAVCGVMLPAELEFEAQVRFEQYGGFNKGRGMVPEVLRRDTAAVVSPLYPLPAFGPGGNMAFRTEHLRSVNGFNPCLGAGTRTHGGEETRVLSLLLSAGHAVLHWPAAITWHTHRREMAALRKQFYGYSAGLTAFYASMVHSRPAVVLDLLRLAPHVLRDIRHDDRNRRSGQLPDDFPAPLLRAARRGLLEGGLMYAYEAVRDRRRPAPAAGEVS